MRIARWIVGPLVVGLALAGGATALWARREPAPLPPLSVETLTPPTGIALPIRIADGEDGAAYAFSSPVDRLSGSGVVGVDLAKSPEPSTFGVFSTPFGPGYESLDAYTDWQRRHPRDSHVVGDLVVENSALGSAVRKDLRMTSGITITQWAVEHEGNLFLVEWMHGSDDDTWRATVEAMIASWQWG